MTRFQPRFAILPVAQKTIWPALAAARAGFVLYGGTALALRLGHRQSADFDFFNDADLDKDGLREKIPLLNSAQTIQDESDALSVLVPVEDDTVKLSFFGGIGFGRVDQPGTTRDGVCEVASILDSFATKLKVLQRIESKDYRDVIAILKSGVPLEQGLGAARALYGRAFQHRNRSKPSHTLRAEIFTYFPKRSARLDTARISGAGRRRHRYRVEPSCFNRKFMSVCRTCVCEEALHPDPIRNWPRR